MPSPHIVLDLPLEVENSKGELVPVTVETLRGNTILHGTVPPTGADGQEGDFWLDLTTAALYGPKGATEWPEPPLSLVGPEGHIGPETVTTADLHAEAVTAAKLGPEAVEAAKIKAGAVTAAKLGPEAVETAAIKNGAVTAPKLGAEAVETAAIKNGAVTTAKLAAEAVETGNIKNGAVTAAKHGAESVETAAIKAGAVTAPKIGAEAVETAAIKLLAVTTGTLAAEAVTAAKIGAEAVETSKIKTEAVTEEKLASSIRKKKFREGHTFVIQGTVATATLPPFYIPIVSGQEAKLVGVRRSIQSGTAAKFRVTKNAAEVSGFGTAASPLSATTSATSTEPTAVSVANGDAIGIVISAVEGTPVGLSITVYVETIC